jgi:ADP-ribosylglycohydrolase
MRVSPVGFAFSLEEEVLGEARRSAEVTHNHPEGIKGAQSVALAVFLARNGVGKPEIRDRLEKGFDYDLQRSVEMIRPEYSFDVSCQGSVPEAVISFLDSESYEDAVRNAVSLGGDSDTLACMAGSIAEAFYGPPEPPLWAEARKRLPAEILETVERFYRTFMPDFTGKRDVADA